jgi:hypothetical protein
MNFYHLRFLFYIISYTILQLKQSDECEVGVVRMAMAAAAPRRGGRRSGALEPGSGRVSSCLLLLPNPLLPLPPVFKRGRVPPAEVRPDLVGTYAGGW